MSTTKINKEDKIFMKVTVKLLTRFVSPLLHVPNTYIDVSSMSAMPQCCNTDQNYTSLSRLERFFLFCNSGTRISKGNVLITSILFQPNWATTLLSKNRIAITFSVSTHLSSRSFNTRKYLTQKQVFEICNMKCMKRKKRENRF